MKKPMTKSDRRKPVLVLTWVPASTVLLGLVRLLIHTSLTVGTNGLLKLVLVNVQIAQSSLSILQLLRVRSLK